MATPLPWKRTKFITGPTPQPIASSSTWRPSPGRARAVLVHEGPEVFAGRGDDPKRVLRPDAMPGDGPDDLPMVHAKHRVKAAAHAIATRQISGGLG
jgi:hypothetical protein